MADSDRSEAAASTGARVTSATTTRITVNGTTYDSLDEMPPEVRAQFQRAMSMLADRDGNGIPDVLEHKGSPAPSPTGKTCSASVVQTTVSRRYKINGQQYDRWEDIPAHYRAMLARAGQGPSGGQDPNEAAMNGSGDKSDADTPRAIGFMLTGPRILLLTFGIAALVIAILWLLATH